MCGREADWHLKQDSQGRSHQKVTWPMAGRRKVLAMQISGERGHCRSLSQVCEPDVFKDWQRTGVTARVSKGARSWKWCLGWTRGQNHLDPVDNCKVFTKLKQTSLTSYQKSKYINKNKTLKTFVLQSNVFICSTGLCRAIEENTGKIWAGYCSILDNQKSSKWFKLLPIGLNFPIHKTFFIN